MDEPATALTDGAAPAAAGASGRHVFLVDGSGFIFRAFHALPPMTRPDGTPVNAVYGFSNMLLKLLNDTDADLIAVIFDAGRTTFRDAIYDQYKAQRPDPPDELIPQFGLIREATRAFNVPCVEMDGFEADDLIATYACQAARRGDRVTIVSSDKDLMQLVGDGIEMLDPIKNKPIGPAEVREKFGVGPDRVIDVQSLAGDAVDNVPGVPGIGIKTAAQLIEEYGDLDTLLARAHEIKQPKRRETLLANAANARISRLLVTLKRDVPVTEALDSFGVRPMQADMLLPFLKQQGFKSLVSRIETRLGVAPDAKVVPADPTTPPASVDYELVQTLEHLEKYLAKAWEVGTVAIGVETDAFITTHGALVGISLAVEPGRACYVPLVHTPPEAQGSLALAGVDAAKTTPILIPREPALARLKALFEDESVLKVGHNIKTHWQVLQSVGIALKPVDDTMLLSYALDGGAQGHAIDELCRRHLDLAIRARSEVCGSGKAQVTFEKVPLDAARDYAAEEVDATLRLHRVFRHRLVLEHMVSVYETLERPLVPVIGAMEQAGIKVDATVLRDLSEDFGRRIVELEAEVQKLAGREFNVGSPKQLGEVLFDEMGLPGGKKTKTGVWQTGADVLEALAAQGIDLAARVLDWRQLSKLKSTYTDTLFEQINPRTGRVHTSYAMALTTTGRLSSSDPNLQNIPIRTEEGRKIRRAFVAEPGHLLVSADYSQIELRLVAHVADIAGLKEAFRSGLDIHAITASQVFGVPVEGMPRETRNRAKAINFGIIYGISAFGLANQLGIPQSEARQYIEAYFARYPEIRAYMDRTKEVARKQGFVSTLYGRKCVVPGIGDKNPAMRSFAERAAINAPIQGGAADIIKRAMVRVPGALAGAGLRARMLLQVHDELVFEVPEAEVEATRALVREVMEQAAVLDVPLVVETGAAKSWAEAH